MLPLHLYVANTPALRRVARQLLQQTYNQAFPGNHFEESIAGLDPRTQFDTLVLFDSTETSVLGTITLMLNPEGQLPSETLMNVSRPAYLPSAVGEVGHTAKNLDMEETPLDRLIFPALVVGIITRLKQRECQGFVCSVKKSLFQSLIRLDLQPQILQQGMLAKSERGFGTYADSETYFVWVDLAVALAGLEERNLLAWLHNGTLQIHTQETDTIHAQ